LVTDDVAAQLLEDERLLRQIEPKALRGIPEPVEAYVVEAKRGREASKGQ
jgi:class 3 adenylate cyclase